MNHEELQSCHARATLLAGRLRLPLRGRVWRGQAGEFAGAGVGSSLDFQDHRAYVPGDDPRHINWQAYARTGQYTMKLFREEVRPVVDILRDVSESMFFDPAKAARIANAQAAGTLSHDSTPLEDRTKDELYDEARRIGIDGRSDMTKDELVKAIRND